jgi:hypothetical protein
MSIKFLELYSGIIGFKGENFETVVSEELENEAKSYSLSFWMYLGQTQKNKQVTVINKGNNLISSPMIALQERTVSIKIDIDKNRTEYLFSSISIPLKK